MSTLKVTSYVVGNTLQAVQLPQQTVATVVGPVTASVRFVYGPTVMVQELPGVRFSCPAQLSFANLYS